jgi:hypothetical protein
MKNSRIALFVSCSALFLGAALLARAADEAKTISGEAKCAKMDLKSQDACQTVILVKEGDKTVSYFVAANDTAKGFHQTVCGHPQKVTAIGTVATVKDQLQFTATKLALAK